jgi:hypothetical protein
VQHGDGEKYLAAATGITSKPAGDETSVDVIGQSGSAGESTPPFRSTAWKVDPLTWPKCGTEMRIISFIFDKAVIDKILTNLGIFEQNSNQRAPPAPAQR